MENGSIVCALKTRFKNPNRNCINKLVSFIIFHSTMRRSQYDLYC